MRIIVNKIKRITDIPINKLVPFTERYESIDFLPSMINRKSLQYKLYPNNENAERYRHNRYEGQLKKIHTKNSYETTDMENK
tara:strand:- start:710 stop:955 length:246 start_codon:yes stop_codon:yes gene_type:complete